MMHGQVDGILPYLLCIQDIFHSLGVYMIFSHFPGLYVILLPQKLRRKKKDLMFFFSCTCNIFLMF